MTKRLRYMFFIAGFAACMLSGCKSLSPAEATLAAGDEVRLLINQNISDTAKAKRMIALIDKLELDMKLFAEERLLINKAIVEKNADYNATREDMQKLYDDLNDKSKAMALKIIQLHVDIQKLSTPAEWKKITSNKNRMGGL